MNTTDFLTVAASICPDRDFMVFGEKRTSYMQAGANINSLASKLAEMGIEKGERIGILSVKLSPIYRGVFCGRQKRRHFCSVKFSGQN